MTVAKLTGHPPANYISLVRVRLVCNSAQKRITFENEYCGKESQIGHRGYHAYRYDGHGLFRMDCRQTNAYFFFEVCQDKWVQRTPGLCGAYLRRVLSPPRFVSKHLM